MRAAALVLLLVSASASAQTEDGLDFVSLGLGGTTGTPGDPYGNGFVSAAIDFRVARRSRLVQVGASGQGEILGRDGVAEAHVLAGVARHRGAGTVTVAAGPSLMRVSRTEWADDERGQPRPGDFSEGYAVGLHASAAALVALVPEVGLGVEAFANVNTRMSVAGIRLAMSLGKLPRSVIR